MKSNYLLYLILGGIIIFYLPLPEYGGFQHSGWLWVVISFILLILIITFNIPINFNNAWMYIGFIGYAFVSLLWLDKKFSQANIQDIVQLTVPLLLWLIARDISFRLHDRYKRLMIPVTPLIITSALVLLIHILTYSTGLYTQRLLGSPMVIIAACSLGLTMAGNIWGWLGLGLSYIFCYLNGSRMAIFTILFLVVITLFHKRSWYKRIIIIVTVSIIAIITFKSANIQNRFFYKGYGSINDIAELRFNTMGRSYLWPLLWDKAWEKPIFGHGAGSSKTYSSTITNGAMPHPHNDYLKIFYEYGILGSFMFLSFFFRSWIYVAKCIFIKQRYIDDVISSQTFLVLTTFFLVAFSGNPILYTAPFMFPMFYILGLIEPRKE